MTEWGGNGGNGGPPVAVREEASIVLEQQLRGVPFFRNLRADALAEIAQRLRLASYPKGTVVFTVLNKGQLPHTFEIQRLQKVTPVVQPGGKSVLRVTFRKAGKYYYLCTVGAHVQYGMFGNLRVTS